MAESKEGGISRRKLLIAGGVLAAGAAVAAVGVSSQKTPEGQVAASPVPTRSPEAPTATPPKTPETKTPEPTPQKTPEPTLTPQQKIELARRLQQEALARGEFKIPVPQEVIDAGGRMEQGEILHGDERDLFAIVPAGKEITFPALVEGQITEAGKLNLIVNIIIIREGDKNLGLLFPATGRILVEKGAKVSLGTPLFSINYDPESPQQKTWEERAKVPKGTIAAVGLQDATAGPGKGFKLLSLDTSLLKDVNGNFITIPTLKK